MGSVVPQSEHSAQTHVPCDLVCGSDLQETHVCVHQMHRQVHRVYVLA